jgi:general secretion pathway protein G
MYMRTTISTRRPETGVTLLEMMMVLAVIALIVGLAAPRIIDSFGRAKSKTATIQMSNVKPAPQRFHATSEMAAMTGHLMNVHLPV